MKLRDNWGFSVAGVLLLSFSLAVLSPNATIAQTTDLIFEDGYENIVPDVAIQSFTIDGESAPTTPIGTTASLNWETTAAESCQASSIPADSVTGWNAQSEIDTAGPQEVSFPGDGIYELKLECFGAGDSTDSTSLTIQVGQTAITTFTVTPDTVDLGTDQSFSLEWESTNTPDGCQGSWPDSLGLPSSGTVNVELTNVQPGLEYMITCSSPFDQDESTVAVTVNDPSVCDVTLESSYFRSWALSFGDAFPGPNFTRIPFAYVPFDGYTAYTFETGDVEDGGFVATFQANGTGGARLISISEVPGCFDVNPNCKTGIRDSDLEWDTTGTSETACQLKKQTTYYWNITFTNGVDPATTRCPGDCYAGLVVNNPDYSEQE